MRQSGFSLLELVIALAVGSIIVSVGLGTMKRMENLTRTKQTASDMAAIREAGLRYYWKNNSFPCCWSELSGYLPPRLINSPVNPYGYAYSFSGSGVRFQVSTIVSDSVAGDLGLEGANRTNNTLTTYGVVEMSPVDIGGVIYEKQYGWSE